MKKIFAMILMLCMILVLVACGESAAQSVLGNKNYEGVFARDMEKAIHYPDRIDFYFKEGTVVTWQKR